MEALHLDGLQEWAVALRSSSRNDGCKKLAESSKILTAADKMHMMLWEKGCEDDWLISHVGVLTRVQTAAAMANASILPTLSILRENIGPAAEVHNDVQSSNQPSETSKQPNSQPPHDPGHEASASTLATAIGSLEGALDSLGECGGQNELEDDMVGVQRGQMLIMLADLYEASGDFDAMHSCLSDALKLLEAHSAQDGLHLEGASALFRMARLHHYQEKAVTSEGLYRAAMDVFSAHAAEAPLLPCWQREWAAVRRLCPSFSLSFAPLPSCCCWRCDA